MGFLSWKWIAMILMVMGLLSGCLLSTGCSTASQKRWQTTLQKVEASGQDFVEAGGLLVEGSVELGGAIIDVPLNIWADVIEGFNLFGGKSLGEALREDF